MTLAYPKLMNEQQVRSVKQNLNYIALEASVLSNMTDIIKSVFPDMLSNLKSAFFSTDNLPDVQIKMTGEHKFIVNEIKAFPFTEYGNLATNVQEGFIGDHVSYLKELIHATDTLKDISAKIIKPYYVYLSVFLSNKDAKKSTHDNDSFYKSIARDRAHLNDTIGKFFHPNDPSSKLKINKVIHNSSGIKDAFEFSNLLKKHVDKINIDEINKGAKQCLELLDVVVEQIKNGNITNVTPEITSNLSNGAYEIARELESFAVAYFRIIGALGTTDNLAKRLDNFIKNIDE